MTDQPPGLRERKKQQTLRAISDAAIALFLDEGFESVPVSRIAERAGVSKPTLFRYFASKEDMALHRLADHEGEAARTVRQRAAGQSPLEALRRDFLRGIDASEPVTGMCDVAEVLDYYRLLFTTASLTARLHTYHARAEEALAEALHEAVPDGPMPELSARLAAGQIKAVQRTLAEANWRRIDAGRTAAEVRAGAVAAAEHGFALLAGGLHEYR